MANPIVRKTKMAAKKRHRLAALRHAAMPSRMAVDRSVSTARRAWVAAGRVRKAIQQRIALAFRKQIEGAGSGPADSELLIFARLAVAEQRLGKNLAQTKARVSAERHHDCKTAAFAFRGVCP